MLDFHCHLIPGVDDGAKTPEISEKMIIAAKSIGIDAIVCTPHVKKRGQGTRDQEEAFEILKPIAYKHGIELFRGTECNLSAIEPDNVADAARYCIEGTKTLLLEMPYDVWPPNWIDIIRKLVVKDISVVIAHPERYAPLERSPGAFETLDSLYCTFQVNAAGIRKNLFGIKSGIVRELLSRRLISYIASDAHRPEDYDPFVKAYNTAIKYGFDPRKMRANVI